MEETHTNRDDINIFEGLVDSSTSSSGDSCINFGLAADSDVNISKLKCGEVYYAWRNGFSFSCCICAAKSVQLECYLAHLLQHDLNALRQNATGKPSTLQISSNDCQMQERSLTPVSATYGKETKPVVSDIRELNIEDTPDGSVDAPEEQSHDEREPTSDISNVNDEQTNFEYVSANVEQRGGEIKHTSDGKSKTQTLKTQMNTKTSNVRQFQPRFRSVKAPRSFACDLCDAKFTAKDVLKLHRYRHLGIKPHKCTLCEKSFTSRTELNLHKRTHTGERPYMCDECGQSFKQSGFLNEHKRRHRDERPHECATCHKRFYGKGALRDHETIHNGLRPHICNTCQATFSRKNALLQHMKLHSDIKEHVCKVCSKSFAQFAGLYSHMKNCHDILKDVASGAIKQK